MVRGFLYSVLLSLKLKRRWPHTVNRLHFYYCTEVACSLVYDAFTKLQN